MVLWSPLLEIDTVTQVQILNEAVYISHSDNPTINFGEGKLWIQTY